MSAPEMPAPESGSERVRNPVRVTALLFAQYRVDGGRERLELELPAGATVRSAAEALEAQLPLSLAGAMAAVNERYSRPEQPLAEGDRVAFLPPVSGG